MSDSCNPVDCSPPVSSVLRILQARILERVAISFSNSMRKGTASLFFKLICKSKFSTQLQWVEAERFSLLLLGIGEMGGQAPH